MTTNITKVMFINIDFEIKRKGALKFRAPFLYMHISSIDSLTIVHNQSPEWGKTQSNHHG